MLTVVVGNVPNTPPPKGVRAGVPAGVAPAVGLGVEVAAGLGVGVGVGVEVAAGLGVAVAVGVGVAWEPRAQEAVPITAKVSSATRNLFITSPPLYLPSAAACLSSKGS